MVVKILDAEEKQLTSNRVRVSGRQKRLGKVMELQACFGKCKKPVRKDVVGN